jgi:hypothetical protein
MFVSKNDLPRLLFRKMFARNVVGVMVWDHDQVRMRHSIARNHIANTVWIELRTNCATQPLSQPHDPCGKLIVDIHEVVDTAFGDQEAFARTYGFMIHEAQDFLIFVKRTCGFSPSDDSQKMHVASDINDMGLLKPLRNRCRYLKTICGFTPTNVCPTAKLTGAVRRPVQRVLGASSYSNPRKQSRFLGS